MTYAEVRKAAEGYCDNEWKKEPDLQVRILINSRFRLSLKVQIGE